MTKEHMDFERIQHRRGTPRRAGRTARLLLALHAVLLACLPLSGQPARTSGTTSSGHDSAVGIEQRIPWTSSRVVGSPDPPSPYRADRVFPKLKFKDPVDLCFAPGSERLFVAEQAGSIYSFRPDAAVSQPDLFVALNKAIPGLGSLYGIAFHPGFETNHYVYLCYVLKDGLADGSRVSRFEVQPGDPPHLDASTEKVIITWLSGGHNGGCIKFGPDGDLYISTGDAASPNPPDSFQTGQDISDLLSSILRIDVDHAEGDRPYRVPKDNPFVGRPDARPEVWAYGLRNPWRMSFDSGSGALWVADVGWELWEMVYNVERGGNYGWSIVEGPQSIHPDWKPGPTPIVPPVKAHPHSEAASITGGFVYRGKRLPELIGAYIYGDWVTGKIWALRSEHGQFRSIAELVDTPLQVVCFGEDHAQELYVVDYGGGIYQLTPNAASNVHLHFPRKLSETGLFTSTREYQLAPGVIPFAINAPAWADYATADRFIGLPGQSQIQTGAKDVWLFQSKNEWRYPTNAVLGRTFSMEMEHGKPASTRRLETQLLHYDGLDWHAYTYRWNEQQDDAALVDDAGGEAVLNILDPSAPGGQREQVWRFHSRTECLRCHNPWVNVALAFTAPQLNRTVSYKNGHPLAEAAAGLESVPGPDVRTANQLRSLSYVGFFDQPLNERSKPVLSNPGDPRADLTERARAWLNVNCAHCHREGAGGSVVSHFDYETPVAEMKAIGRRPSQGTFGLDEANVITPGFPDASVLCYRVSTSGQGHMPLIGSRLPDPVGLKLLSEWIRQVSPSLAEDKAVPAPGKEHALQDSLRTIQSATGTNEVSAALDQLLGSPSGALALFLSLITTSAACPPQLIAKVADHPSFQVHDLFEPFLPESLRPKKLGPNIKPEAILSLQGDAKRGEQLFFREATQCSRCHRLGAQGREFGPDLSQVVRKYSRSQLLEQILFPSKQIDPAFVSYQVETKGDVAYTGFVLKRSSEEVLLKDANLNLVRIPAGDIKSIQPSQVSAMPEGLLQTMTAQDAADLLAFLSRPTSDSSRSPASP